VAKTLCTYTWEKPNAEEIRARVAKQRTERIREMMKAVRRGKSGQGMVDMAMNMPSENNEVSLTLPELSFRTAEQARTAFEANIERMREGISQRVQTKHTNQEVRFQLDYQPVSGIGDSAYWNARTAQLAVLDGTRFLYVVAKLEEDQAKNLEHAKKLALQLISE
jgi:hypothetical protein